MDQCLVLRAIMVYVITKALRHGQMLGITCDDGGGGTPMI